MSCPDVLADVAEKLTDENLVANAASKAVDDHQDLECLSHALSTCLKRNLVNVAQAVFTGHSGENQVG